jgi:hypothetical protein
VLEGAGRRCIVARDARLRCAPLLRDLLEHFRHLAIVRATGDRSVLAGLPDAESRS